MPTYEYECDACHHSFEALQSMIEKKFKKCPKCGKLKLQRLIGSGSGIIFKGSGFYETDYKQKSPAKDASPKVSSASDTSSSPSSKPSSPCGPSCGCGSPSSISPSSISQRK